MANALSDESNRLDHKNGNRDGQDASAFGRRIRERAQFLALSQSDVRKKAGISKQSMAGYWNGDRLCGSDKLFDLADALDTSARWLITGRDAQGRMDLVDATDADWIPVPEFDLRNLTDESKGAIVSRTPIRRDWLNRTFGQATGLWLARLPADLPRYDLREGDLAIMRDVAPDEAQDGAVYVVRLLGHLTVVRLDALQDAMPQPFDGNMNDRRLAFRHLARSSDDREDNDSKAHLVARVLGVPLKRL